VFPLPMDLLEPLLGKLKKSAEPGKAPGA
jgi:hypothetical protein